MSGNNINSQHHTRIYGVGSQPPAPTGFKGPEPSKGKTSTHAHPDLTSRGSPGHAADTGSLPPRRLLERSNALAPQPRKGVQFNDKARVPEEKRDTVVKFGPKDKPVRIRDKEAAQHTSAAMAAPAPAPEPPKSPEHESMRARFRGMFRSKDQSPDSSPPRPTEHQPAEQRESTRARIRDMFRSKDQVPDTPVSNSPPRRAQASASGSAQRPERSHAPQPKPAAHRPGVDWELVNQWRDMVDKLPDRALASQLRQHLSGTPSARRNFTKIAGDALAEHKKDKASFSLLLEMVASVNSIAPNARAPATRLSSQQELRSAFHHRWSELHDSNLAPGVKAALSFAGKKYPESKDGGEEFIKQLGWALQEAPDGKSLAAVLSALDAMNEVTPQAALSRPLVLYIGRDTSSTPRWSGAEVPGPRPRR